MPLTIVEENRDVIEKFSILNKKKRLAHAYLFIGPEGTGKFQTALYIAQLINCEENTGGLRQEYCGECSSCRKVISGNHPDITVIDSQGEPSIKIAQVRVLINRSQLKPYEAKVKIYIIRDAQMLTLEASNALLKTLEEPTASSLLILTSSVPEKLLSTIRSRCHPVKFYPLPKDELTNRLAKEVNVDNDQAHFLSLFSEGSLARAHVLMGNGFFQKKNKIIDNLIFNESSETFIKEITGQKDKTKEALDVLLMWFRDLVLIKAGTDEESVVHKDRLNELSMMAPHYSFEQLEAIIKEIINTSKQLMENLNIKVPFNIIMEKIWVK